MSIRDKYALLAVKIHENSEEILSLFEEHKKERDFFYRFYYGSFKAYWIQPKTSEILLLFKKIAGEDLEIDNTFLSIVEKGTGIDFVIEHNKQWNEVVLPITNAYLHAFQFLMYLSEVVEESKDQSPEEVFSDLISLQKATILCLFSLR